MRVHLCVHWMDCTVVIEKKAPHAIRSLHTVVREFDSPVFPSDFVASQNFGNLM